MPRPTTPAEICNLALLQLGERGVVVNIETPTNDMEVLCSQQYDLTRRGLLEEYVWNFAREEKQIARTGDGGVDYTDRYLMPSDCLRIISLGPNHCVKNYDIHDREIYVHANWGNTETPGPLIIRYVKDHTDVSRWSSLFTRVLIIQLAIDLSYGINQKTSQVQMLAQRLSQELPKATSVNSQQKKPRVVALGAADLNRIDAIFDRRDSIPDNWWTYPQP